MEQKEFKERYGAQMIKRGADSDFAKTCADVGWDVYLSDADPDPDTPEDLADSEMSYWTE